MAWQLGSYAQIQNPLRKQFLAVTFIMVRNGATAPVPMPTASNLDLGELRIINPDVMLYYEPHVSDQAVIPKLAADWIEQYDKIDAQAAAPLGLLAVQDAVSAILTARRTPKPVETDEEKAAREARNAWLVLYRDWQAKKKIVDAGASKAVMQDDVDAAATAWKATFIDAYAVYLQEVKP